MENQMNIENQIQIAEQEMESWVDLACEKMEALEEAGNFSDEFYELDGILHDINYIHDDYAGEELVMAMVEFTSRLQFILN